MHKIRGTGLLPWPQRLTASPPRLEEIGSSADEFQEDTVSILIDTAVTVLYLKRSAGVDMNCVLLHNWLNGVIIDRAYGILELVNTGTR